MSPDEHQRLAADAETFGKSLPDMLRVGYFRGAPAAPLVAKREAQAILVALARLGNNVNQIARQVNSASRPTYASEFTALSEEVAVLNTVLRSVCSGLRTAASGG